MSAFGEYYSIQKGIFHSKLSGIIKSAKDEISNDPKNLFINWIVVFKDESILETFEYLEINNNIIKKTNYGYEYKRNSGYFFFYEMEKEKCRVDKPDTSKLAKGMDNEMIKEKSSLV